MNELEYKRERTTLLIPLFLPYSKIQPWRCVMIRACCRTSTSRTWPPSGPSRRLRTRRRRTGRSLLRSRRRWRISLKIILFRSGWQKTGYAEIRILVRCDIGWISVVWQSFCKHVQIFSKYFARVLDSSIPGFLQDWLKYYLTNLLNRVSMRLLFMKTFEIRLLYNCTALQPYNRLTVQPNNSTTVQPYNCATVQQYNCIIVQSYNRTTVQPYNYITVQLYCRSLTRAGSAGPATVYSTLSCPARTTWNSTIYSRSSTFVQYASRR